MMDQYKPYDDYKVDMKGHNYQVGLTCVGDMETYSRYQVAEEIHSQMSMMRFTREDAKENFKPYPLSFSINHCLICGEKVALRETGVDSKQLQALVPCPFPDGLPAFEIELDIPSGKMVWGNDFRELFSAKDDFNINAVIGVMQTVQSYESVGMLHFFVGNSCPAIFLKGDDEICVSPEYSEETDDRKSPGEGFVEKLSICTDLWWVSCMDYGVFQTLCREKGIEEESLSPEKVLSVRSGKWSFYFDPNEGCEFTKCYGRTV